jgi:alkylhydroperoxidase family enzyme
MFNAISKQRIMTKLIPRLSQQELHPDLEAFLRPRIDRLGYLGEFFQCTAHQPEALLSFLEFTDHLKHALPNNLTEVVSLSVAQLMDNSYERVQHERLSLKLGFGENWLREVLSLSANGKGTLSEREVLVQRLVVAVLNRKGHNTTRELETVIQSIGPAMTIAILMLIGRYVSHAMIVNSLNLAAPVPSPLETNP